MKHSQLSLDHVQEFNYNRSQQWLISPPGIELDWHRIFGFDLLISEGGFCKVLFRYDLPRSPFEIVKYSDRRTKQTDFEDSFSLN